MISSTPLSPRSTRWRRKADQRHALDLQLEQQRRLCDQRSKAQAVMADLRAFCGRVEIRLEGASFVDRQALLQLVVERIIVHDGSLEIRHVIPLRSPPAGRESTADPAARLRSDRMHPTALVRGMEDPACCRPQPLVIVGNHQLHPAQAPVSQRAQEGGPERFGF